MKVNLIAKFLIIAKFLKESIEIDNKLCIIAIDGEHVVYWSTSSYPEEHLGDWNDNASGIITYDNQEDAVKDFHNAKKSLIDPNTNSDTFDFSKAKIYIKPLSLKIQEQILKERMAPSKFDAINKTKKLYKTFGPWDYKGKQLGPYKVYLVNDYTIRNTSPNHEEYSDFAVHTDFPDIVPKNEIWISDHVSERERQFYMLHALRKQVLIDRGMDPDAAYEKALSFEKGWREKIDGA